MNESSDFYPRLLKKRIIEAMTDTPVVMLAGSRQAGKTTLVRQFSGRGMRYITLDDEVVSLSAKEDPVGLIRGLDRAIIDEVQRAPRLLTAIKKTVDEDRRPGRFLLTGSANLMALPVVADSLAGRMETLRLLPLSQSELRGTGENWIDAAFAGHVLQPDPVIIGDELTETVLRGGYPEAVSRITQKRRTAWCRQYIEAILRRDVRDVAHIEKLSQMPKLLQTLAHYSGHLCNYSRIGGHIDLDQKSIARYIAVLEHMFLVKRIPVFSNNRLKRLVKTPKIHFIDPGLLAALQDMSVAKGKEDRSSFGNILETFVYSELFKHTTNAEGDYRLFYYRDHDQNEIDFIIENAEGHIIGVEVKTAATVKKSDLRGLKRLSASMGTSFKRGFILYDGAETFPLGNELWAAPVSSLWGSSS